MKLSRGPGDPRAPTPNLPVTGLAVVVATFPCQGVRPFLKPNKLHDVSLCQIWASLPSPFLDMDLAVTEMLTVFRSTPQKQWLPVNQTILLPFNTLGSWDMTLWVALGLHRELEGMWQSKEMVGEVENVLRDKLNRCWDMSVWTQVVDELTNWHCHEATPL